MCSKMKFEPKRLLTGWRQMTKAQKVGFITGAVLLGFYLLAWAVWHLFLK